MKLRKRSAQAGNAGQAAESGSGTSRTSSVLLGRARTMAITEMENKVPFL